MPYIVFDNEAYGSAFPLGGKADALACLQKNGLPVPRWFAITPEALGAADIAFNTDFTEALEKVLGVFFEPGELLAVRSSALEEDGQTHSFAGMFESHLFVPRHQVAEKILDIWHSARSPRVLAYCNEQNVPTPTHTPVVIVQRMVNARAAGVAFSADPVTGLRNVVVVSAVHGLGSALVSGECDADTAYLAPDGTMLHYRAADKQVIHQCNPDGGLAVLPGATEQRREPAISPAEATAIAAMIRRAEAIYGEPQDMEWAIANNQLYLLQSRPITTLLPVAASATAPVYAVLTNAALVESWHGAVTPLTFAFARRLVTTVYKSLSHETCIEKTPRDQFGHLFDGLVQNVDGRIYLNQTLLEVIWRYNPSLEYKLGQFYNRAPLPAPEKVQIATRFWTLAGSFILLPWSNARFIARVSTVLATTNPKSGDGVLELHGKLCKTLRLLDEHWRVPALNNYFAGSFYKLCNWISTLWLGEPMRQHAWLGNDTETVSRDLMRRLQEMAAMAGKDTGLREALQLGNAAALRKYPAFLGKYEAYVARYGERCQDDLKLESLSLSDDPASLFQAIHAMAASPRAEAKKHERSEMPDAGEGLTGFRKIFWRWLLATTRQQVSCRERLRFELTRIAGRIRTLVVAIGKKLAEAGDIEKPDDVFYMGFEELSAWIAGDKTASITQRRETYEKQRNLPEPPTTLSTYGPLRFSDSAGIDPDARQVSGIGCSPGQVRAAVRVFSPDRPSEDYAGCILAVPYGDPGLVVLFPLLKGLLFAHGSALSHAAIVARELGVSAVTGLPGLMSWVADGEWISMDGESGLVEKIEP